MTHKLSPIEDAIDDIKKGKLVIVVDDEDRENEGDFITAARNIRTLFAGSEPLLLLPPGCKG